MRRGVDDGSRRCLELGPRLVEAGAAVLTLHPRSAKQMYTGYADHTLTAELVSLVDVPVIASGDITSRAKAEAVLEATGAAAVMVGRGAQGNPWAIAEIVSGDAAQPSREEVAAELIHFIRETVRELGERRASGFLKKFYAWYLGHGRFPKPFKNELVQLHSTDEVVTRLLAAAPGAAALVERLEAELPDERDPPRRDADLDLRRRLSQFRRAASAGDACARWMRDTPPRSSSTISTRSSSRASASTSSCAPRTLAACSACSGRIPGGSVTATTPSTRRRAIPSLEDAARRPVQYRIYGVAEWGPQEYRDAKQRMLAEHAPRDLDIATRDGRARVLAARARRAARRSRPEARLRRRRHDGLERAAGASDVAR